MSENRFLTVLLIFCTSLINAAVIENPHPRISPDGKYVIVTQFPEHRFYVINLETREGLVVEGSLSAGLHAVWSPDSGRIGFKIILENPDGRRMQAPAVLDIQSAQIELLDGFYPLAGNPSFSRNGKISYTIGSTLYVKDGAGKSSLTIPDYCNRTAVSPDGNQIAYNDASDQIYIFDQSTHQHLAITPEQESFCGSSWSEDGKYLLVRTVSGILSVYEVKQQHLQKLGRYSDASWCPNSRHILAVQKIFDNDRLTGSRLVILDLDGGRTVLLEDPSLFPLSPSMDDSMRILCFSDAVSGNIFRMDPFDSKPAGRVQLDTGDPGRYRVVPLPEVKHASYSKDSQRSITYIRGVPYHHQVYCTPYDFNGHWACNATAATMAIAYYGVFADWNFTATTPFSHTSHYGNYVSEIYTYNGHTYNISSPDASGNPAYGGYGYIVQDDWEDTKTHMMEYISYHNLSSPYVDWSPSWEELQAETVNRMPFVILTYITTSGHYKTVVGYHDGQHTAYLNDPYGNKNQGYMNFNGAGVSYDWPYYNNGYQNMNEVFCYIYARGSPPAIEPGTAVNPISIGGFPYTDNNTTRSSGGQDLLDYYNSAPSVNEEGREKLYTFTATGAGNLTVSVICDGAVDIDIHLLSSPDAGSCIRRADISFTEHIVAGTYWLSCDTYVNGSNVELMGDYTLTCSFTPDAIPSSTPTSTRTPTPTQTLTRTPTPSPTPSLTRTPTATSTRTPSVTPSPVFTPTNLPSNTPTGTGTTAPSATPTPTMTSTPDILPVPAESVSGLLAVLAGISLLIYFRLRS